MTLDFSLLYADLGLHPDCSLEQYKRAYRQRLSELHPDHSSASQANGGLLQLHDLIALHTSAMQFQREHGRLPGGTVPTNVVPAAPVARPGPAASPPPDDTAESRTTSTRWLLVPLFLVGALLASIILERAPQPSVAPVIDSTPMLAQPEPSIPTPDGPLELGMDAETVRAIQGEPLRIEQDTWEYGPSWLRIEHNRLVDWHSSPLYRLKTRTPSPTGGADTDEKNGR